MSQTEIQKLEQEIYDNYRKLVALRRDTPEQEVKNYAFETMEGTVELNDLFGEKEELFVIHNMGQGCSYCTLWADGLNAFLPHLEDRFSVVMASKDSPAKQRVMANDRGWRFRMVSHGGGEYIKEQSTAQNADTPEANNYPGVVFYRKEGNKILRKNRAAFGPGDEFCSLWNLLSLAGVDEETWTPKYSYWKS